MRGALLAGVVGWLCACAGTAPPTKLQASGRIEANAPEESVTGQSKLDAPQSPSRSAPAAPPADHGEEFLVHGDDGQLVVRNTHSSTSRVLAEHADAALYDSALELVWLRDADRLLVVDLRTPEPAPVVIARGLPAVNRLEVERGAHSVETEDGCDLPSIALVWNATPEIESVLSDEPAGRVENPDWLRAMLDRPARHASMRRPFSDLRIRLPKQLVDCEDPSSCLTTVAFGGFDHELVMVRERMGGDCWQRACLVRDRKTGLFASPLELTAWSPAERASLGPCGVFYFDEAQTSFLVGRWLCKFGAPCVGLGGTALGWLVPGEAVGEPGLGNFD